MQLRFRTTAMLGLLLGSFFLISCGQERSQTEGLSPNASPATAQTPAADTATSSEASSPQVDTAEPKADGSATAIPINPPQAATLKAQEVDAQINLRSQPTTDSASKGYGLVGDTVTLTQAADGADNFTWYYVQFEQSGAEGWIRGDFINTAAAPSNTELVGAVSIDSYTIDELFAVDGGGCGMSLKRAGTNQFIFFNGLETTSMWMKLDGTMTPFRKTATSGEDFYGQTTTQSFISLDGFTQVEVTVTPGTEVGYEVINVESGQLRLDSGGEVLEIAVEGDAGC
ncbi:MAG: SH3 domain-containing protein [Cyanobacteria bacterium J06638_28]